jgi:hypothetical protein
VVLLKSRTNSRSLDSAFASLREADATLGMTVGGVITQDRCASSKFYGQATKGAWWMPWQKQAKKDVASCDKPRGAARRH